MKTTYSATVTATFQFHLNSKTDRQPTGEELKDLVNAALWGRYNEDLEIEFKIECDGKSKNQDSLLVPEPPPSSDYKSL